MLERFLDNFKLTSHILPIKELKFNNDIPIELFRLFSLFGGSTFNNGLYRLHSYESSLTWTLIIEEYFASYRNSFYPFGYDWMGRQFCLSKESGILFMFDPSTGEDFKLEQNLLSFHDDDLVDDIDDMLASSLFKDVLLSLAYHEIKYSECLGFKIPLFLGGKDDLLNYEKQDLEVYWHISNQLYTKTRNLPGGTKIGNISVK